MTGNRIRCLFILHDLAGGGAEKVTLNLIRTLDRGRFAPVLFVFESIGQLHGDIPEDVPLVVGQKTGQGFIGGRLSSLKNLLSAAREADIIVGALEHQAIFFAAVASALTGKPAIGWVHKDILYYASHLSALKRLLYRTVIAIFFQRLAAVVAVSRGVAASLTRILPRLHERVRVIYNPIDPHTIAMRALEAPPDWAAQVFAKPVVIAAGRLEHVKGFDVLIDAHALLRGRGNDLNLLIVGEGTQRHSLEEIISARGVSENVFMPGFCNPFPLMACSRVFALSSRSEGMPTVVIEAMAMGLPVVATRCPGGSEELLDGGRYGVLVRPEDAVDLATHLEQVLRDPERVRLLTQAARTMAVETFDPLLATARWERLLEATVTGQKSI